MKNSLPLIILLSLITLTVSCIQTAYGYELILGNVLTWVISIVITILMFSTQMQLRSRLSNKQSVIGLLLFYFIIASISFGGNFNSFYSRSMKKELHSNELKSLQSDILALSKSSAAALNKSSGFAEIESELNSIIKSVYAQITNSGNPGIGKETRKLLKQFESKTGRSVTELTEDWSRGNSKSEVFDALANDMRKQMEGHVEDIRIEKTSGIQEALETIDNSSEILDTIEYALEEKNIVFKGKNAIQKAVKTYNDICKTTIELLPSFECKEKKEFNTEVGNLTHTYNSAFIRMENPSATFINAFLSLFIDFLVPIFIFLTVKTGSGGSNSNGETRNTSYVKRENVLTKTSGILNPQPKKAKRL